MKRLTCVLMAATFAAAGLVQVAPAQAGRVDLEKAIPTGVYIFVHGAKNPEREFLDKHWAKVWKALAETHIDSDIHDLILAQVPAAEQEDFQASWDKWMNLICAVDWSDLFSEEVVFAGRMMFPAPEYILLTRPSKESFEKNVEALHSLLADFAGLAEGLTLTESAVGGGKMWTLAMGGAPFTVHLLQYEDVVGLGFGQGLMRAAVGLLSGEAGQKSLVASPRFREAFRGLPPAEDARVFFDISAMCEGIDKILTSIPAPPPATAPAAESDQPSGAGQPPNEALMWINVGRGVLREAGIFDCMASVEYTEGLRTIELTNTSLKPGAKDMALYDVFCSGKPIEKFDEFVPKEATSFTVSSGMDCGALYKAVTRFVGNDVPDGKVLLAQWEAVQEQISFNVEKDLLSWLGTKSISVSMPPSSPMGMMTGGGDWIYMLQVTDSEAASQKISEWLTSLAEFMVNQGQPLQITPAQVGESEGFQMVTHPAMMMFLRPVIGVARNYLIIASSPRAIEKVLETAAGEHPSIMENKRFKEEGLVPTGAVQEVSFQDMRGQFQQIGQALGMAGIIGAFIPTNDPKAAPVKAIIGIVQKLGPVVASIDFYESTASVSSFDGKAFHSKKITNYKPYKEPAPPEPAETAGEEEPAAVEP